MNNIFVTMGKELRSILRDKKTLMTMFLFPLLIPAMIIFYGYMYDNVGTEEESINILVNFEIPDDVKKLSESINMKEYYFETEDLIKERYDAKKYNAYIIYDSVKDVYTIYSDSSNAAGLECKSTIYSFFEIYSRYLHDNYLLEHEIDLNESYYNFNLEEVELGNNNYIVQMILVISFTYIVMSICMAVTNMTISTTAAEKENGTLETILTFPIKKSELMIGKFLSCVLMGVLSSFVGLILMIIGLVIAKNNFDVYSSYVFTINVKTIILALIVITSASMFISGIAFILTSNAATFKEAQSKSSFVNMVCVIPMFVSLLEVELTNIYYLIPICNFEQILSDIFTNNLVMSNLLITVGSTFGYIVAVLVIVIFNYNNEKVLFNS